MSCVQLHYSANVTVVANDLDHAESRFHLLLVHLLQPLHQVLVAPQVHQLAGCCRGMSCDFGE
eukprot:6893085-Prorocentrum_lima.AAC.1